MAGGPSKEFPLYVGIVDDQEAYLHHGNATSVEEAMAQLQQITSQPILKVLEITYCKMFDVSIKEITGKFCPACGATGRDAMDCNCDR